MNKLNELTYVTQAETVISKLQQKNNYTGQLEVPLTTSKIRNLLSMITDIYNEAVLQANPVLSVELQGRVQYLKLRFIYEAGREKTVKNFVEKAEIIEYINQIGDNRNNLLLFCKYMEALVAYHKYYGGRD